MQEPKHGGGSFFGFLYLNTSYVVPHWVCCGLAGKDCDIVTKRELHRRVWVNFAELFIW